MAASFCLEPSRPEKPAGQTPTTKRRGLESSGMLQENFSIYTEQLGAGIRSAALKAG